MNMWPNRSIKIISLLFFVALAVRLFAILYWRFDGLYGQDAYAYFQQALAIMHNLGQGQPPPSDFFWPNGYPLLIALFTLFLGQTALAAQTATLLCGALLAPMTYLLSRDLWTNEHIHQPEAVGRPLNNPGSLVAGLIVATAGQPILSSVVIMADIPALFLASLATWCVITGVQAGRQPADYLRFPPAVVWFLAAGATLALAIISRWVYIVIIPALGGYTLIKIYQHKTAWWHPVSAVFSGTSILVPQIWLSLHRPEGLFHSHLLGWQFVHFFQRQFENPDGYHSYKFPNAIFYAQPAGHPAYIFPLLGLMALWGIWRLWQTKQWGVLALLAGWFAPAYLFLSGIPFQNFRFGLTYYIPLVILTGFGLNDLFVRATAWQTDRKESVGQQFGPTLLKAVIIFSMIGMLAWAYPMLHNFLTTQNQSKTIAYQVEQVLPEEATLLTFGLTLTFQHYTQLKTLELFYLDPTALETLTAIQTPLYILLDPHNIETQWRGRPPEQNYRWLRTHTVLEEISTFPPYVLFKVAQQ